MQHNITIPALPKPTKNLGFGKSRQWQVKAARDQMAAHIRDAPPLPFAPAALVYRFTLPTRRVRDIDGLVVAAAPWLDAIAEHHGLDDNDIQLIVAHKRHIPGRERTSITLLSADAVRQMQDIIKED